MDRIKISSLVNSSCVFTLAFGAYSTHSQSSTGLEPAKDAPIAAARPEPEVRPQRPAGMPAKLPQVACAAGQLTIVADNSTLASILAGLHGCVGAAIDLPMESSSTRVFANLGPGPINQVLQSLLSSTDLDYVIQLSSADSSKVQAVYLTARTDGARDVPGAPELASTPARRAWLETRRNAHHGQQDSDDSQPTNSTTSANEAPNTTPVIGPVRDTPTVAVNIKADTPATVPSAQANLFSARAAVASSPNTAAPANDAAAMPTDPSASPAADSNPAPPAPQDAASPADKEMQDKITNMEQLFDKRKQMMETPTTPKQQ